MKVLLLHPEDDLSPRDSARRWDLVIDFGRAPASTYDRWRKQLQCRVISLFDFAREVEDLHETKKLLQLGMGRMVDRQGIDWWDLLSLEIAAQLQQLMLLHRLANDLSPNCQLFSSRPLALATALQRLCGGSLINLETGAGSALRHVRHYKEAFSQLTAAQVIQVLQDKFDSRHEYRRRFAARELQLGNPVVLLPSAYISVSRVAVSYAALLPDVQFLLACARRSGQLRSLPSNVRMVSLDSYFGSVDESQTTELVRLWSSLKWKLIRAAVEFESADAVGVLARMPDLIGWGFVLRTAWERVFKAENIIGCLCADDSNTYTRIPLLLARKNEVPALACHHGALDAWMAIKTNHADFYLAKGEMERDYLVRTCRVAAQKIIVGAPAVSNTALVEPAESRASRPWLVFFSESYHSSSWRSEEVYRELLPRLMALAQTCKLEMVFKLHPFESIKGHRRLLRRFLPKAEAARVRVIAGAPSPELWRKTRIAVTGQSTIAVDCATRGIPVFLCSWLRDPHTGYLQQYGRFGIGQILESIKEIDQIPRLMESQSASLPAKNRLQHAIDPETLRELLGGTSVLPVAAQG